MAKRTIENTVQASVAEVRGRAAASEVYLANELAALAVRIEAVKFESDPDRDDTPPTTPHSQPRPATVQSLLAEDMPCNWVDRVAPKGDTLFTGYVSSGLLKEPGQARTSRLLARARQQGTVGDELAERRFTESLIDDSYRGADLEALINDRPALARRFLGALMLQGVRTRRADRLRREESSLNFDHDIDQPSAKSRWVFKSDGPVVTRYEEIVAPVIDIAEHRERRKKTLREYGGVAVAAVAVVLAVGVANSGLLSRFVKPNAPAVAEQVDANPNFFISTKPYDPNSLGLEMRIGDTPFWQEINGGAARLTAERDAQALIEAEDRAKASAQKKEAEKRASTMAANSGATTVKPVAGVPEACLKYVPLMEKNGLPVLATALTAFAESGCKENAISDTDDYGVMQINGQPEALDPEVAFKIAGEKYRNPRIAGNGSNYSAWYAVCPPNSSVSIHPDVINCR